MCIMRGYCCAVLSEIPIFYMSIKPQTESKSELKSDPINDETESKQTSIYWTHKDTTTDAGWMQLLKLCKSHRYGITSDRGFNLYKNLFSASALSLNDHLKTIIASKEGQTNQLKALDCGSGRGVALKNLLNEFKEFELGTGISMHAFVSVAEDIKRFHGRLDGYFAKAQNVLSSLPSCKYHMITDVWGPYFYSIERPYLLNEYWRLLDAGGCAFIILGNSLNDVIKCRETKRIDSFVKYLAKTWPKTFYVMKGSNPWLLIRKYDIDEAMPNLDFEIVNCSSLSLETKKGTHSKTDMSYPDHIIWHKLSNKTYVS